MLEAETVFFQAKSRILEKMTEEIAAMPQNCSTASRSSKTYGSAVAYNEYTDI